MKTGFAIEGQAFQSVLYNTGYVFIEVPLSVLIGEGKHIMALHFGDGKGDAAVIAAGKGDGLLPKDGGDLLNGLWQMQLHRNVIERYDILDGEQLITALFRDIVEQMEDVAAFMRLFIQAGEQTGGAAVAQQTSGHQEINSVIDDLAAPFGMPLLVDGKDGMAQVDRAAGLYRSGIAF